MRVPREVEAKLKWYIHVHFCLKLRQPQHLITAIIWHNCRVTFGPAGGEVLVISCSQCSRDIDDHKLVFSLVQGDPGRPGLPGLPVSDTTLSYKFEH